MKKVTVCKKTRSCRYGGKMGGIRICDYYEITGTRRPCPVQDCTEYERRSGRRKAVSE